jgi:hypothetical protein
MRESSPGRPCAKSRIGPILELSLLELLTGGSQYRPEDFCSPVQMQSDLDVVEHRHVTEII